MEGMGISTPYCVGMNLPDTYRALHVFIGALRPMIKADQLALAREEAPKIIKGLGAPESRPRWFGKPAIIKATK